MKIAILSDIHDNIWTLRAALAALQSADMLICCGDLCSPFIVPLLAENFSKPIHLVFGNNDGDLFRITKNAGRFGHFHIAGELFQAVIDGKSIAANHYDSIALEIARTGTHDVVCFGHNHRYQVARFGKTLAVNPGTLLGYSPLDNRDVAATYIIYDTVQDATFGYQVLQPGSVCSQMLIEAYP